jgi:cell division transport system permease protein
MMRALSYSFSEAVASLWRGRQNGMLSTATIGVALFVLGGSLIVTSNLEHLAAEWGRTAEMSVYLTDAIDDTDRAALETLLEEAPPVATFEYVSKEDAIARFQSTFVDLAGAVDTLDGNPLPASYEVRLEAGAGAPGDLDALVEGLRAAPGVDDVRYDRQWIDRLLMLVTMLRAAGLGLGAILTFAASLTIANVVRLALFARRDEIEIMQLVGAPQAYVRGPFIAEGVLQGGVGAIVALSGLAAVFLLARGPYLIPLADAVNISAIRFLPLSLSLLLLGGGMVVGCLGGLVAAWGRT